MQYNFKGTYDVNQNYVVKDVVSFTQNGITKYYFCLNPNYNTNPQQPSQSSDSSYWGVINALSNFPNSVDQFIYRVNISGNDKVDIARINELTLKTSLTIDEQDELTYLISKHKNKLFQADDLNAIQDSLSNLQIFFKDKVESYINSSLNDITIVRDEALSSLETKKSSLDLYLDSTTAGALRVDIGVMGDLTTTNKHSLVEALNETRNNTQVYKLTEDDGKVKTLALNTDLNIFKSTGLYFSLGTNINSPFISGGVLEIFNYGVGSGERVLQRYTRNYMAETWERIFDGSAWGGWVKLATNAEAQMIKITSDIGATKLYAYTNTDDILALIVASGMGLHTFYASAISLNKPTSDSIRGFAHITGMNPSNGYVQAYDYHGNSFTNYILNGVWQGWRQLNSDKDTQTALWTGAALMHAPSGVRSTVVPTKKLSECRNGWILVWSDYDAGVGSGDFDFNYSFIPKFTASNINGGKHIFPIGNFLSTTTNNVACKALQVWDDKLVGYDENNYSATSSNDVCLRYVLEW